jgi:DNA-binding transcriptional ArsR family regulator
MSTTASRPRRGPAGIEVFRAISDPTRRALLDLLRTRDRSVSELAGPFQMTQPAISQHLRVLRHAGLVKPLRVGRQRVYRLNAKPLRRVRDWAARYERFWHGKLAPRGDDLDA